MIADLSIEPHKRGGTAMQRRLSVTVFLIGILHTIRIAGGEPSGQFVDGLWNGGIEIGSEGEIREECWASTTSPDGTTFKLARRHDLNWYLRLSNADWELPPHHRYSMVAQVDFYPQLRIDAEAKSKTTLEIDGLEEIHLLGLIENGHFIELRSDEFHAKYILEGSAKIIQRVRSCMAG